MRAVRRLRLVVVVTAVLLATLLPASPVWAGTISVTTTADDFNTDGTTCSLREAVHSANADIAFGGCQPGLGADQITLPAGTYQFSRSGTELLADVSIGDLDVDGVLTIVGQGHPTIDGNDLDRIFQLVNVDSLSLQGLTLTDGTAVSGGAIRIQGASSLSLVDVVVDQNAATTAMGASASGGGIRAQSSDVSIVRSRITNNMVTTADPADESFGGGILLFGGSMTVTDSFISGNSAQDFGGGIDVIQDGTATFTNTTISSNRAGDGDGIAFRGATGTLTNVTIAFNGQAVGGKGGGMYADPREATDVIALQNVTFSNNTGGSSGGGGSIHVVPTALGSVTAKNTIAAHPQAGGNCDGKAVSSTNGYNLEFVPGGTNSPCFAADPTTVFGDPMFPVDPLAAPNIAPPADNGGPTPTLALGTGSAALNAGVPAFGITSDQRGVPRPFGAAPDIGAYERSFCGDVLVNVVGTAGNDSLTGTAGSDGILGLGGNDSINGLGARDGLCGGAGNDILDGSAGNDHLDGGANNDILVPGTGLDRVIGGSNSDTVSYASSPRAVNLDLRLSTALATGQGRDTISGVENVVGTRFADVIRGSNGGNWLRLGGGGDSGFGYGGADRIDGGSGSDRLFGGTGNDALFGEAGNDFFDGGSGRDRCRQGPGTGRRISCELR
jgi:CSLREA domain-containing protein